MRVIRMLAFIYFQKLKIQQIIMTVVLGQLATWLGIQTMNFLGGMPILFPFIFGISIPIANWNSVLYSKWTSTLLLGVFSTILFFVTASLVLFTTSGHTLAS